MRKSQKTHIVTGSWRANKGRKGAKILLRWNSDAVAA